MTNFILETERLTIRNWQDGDREAFYRINSDDDVMRFFPYKRTREESDAFLSATREDISQNGFGYTAIALKSTDECIGFCGLHSCNADPVLSRELMEIGWRLLPEHWGKGYVTEAAKSLLEYGFEVLNLPEILSFAVHNNHKSFAVMERIGMLRCETLDFDHPRVPDSHPRLKRHLVYRIRYPDHLPATKKGG